MQSRHIKANIVAAIAICTGSLGVSVFLIKLSEIDLSGRPVASDRRVALQLSKSRSDPALVFQELKIAQSIVGQPAQVAGVEDLIWTLAMLPEFQLIY